jgi:2-polyprenyl-6-hydroxyphenyl methylase/3-demethylubiquinone-9 3-methyltransferase
LTASQHAQEVDAGERFTFGKNWARFLPRIDESRIASAEHSLQSMLGQSSLAGRRFLDIGSGSGLFSLAAHRLGAEVVSFDYDPDSYRCTKTLQERYQRATPPWRVIQGSALDRDFLAELGTFDVVYSWGVLHHTGSMWQALDNAVAMVASGGSLFIAIYNDQGAWSPRWRRIKKLYVSGVVGRALVVGTIVPYWVLRNLAADLFWMRNPLRRYRFSHPASRGMSFVTDWLDWLGGYPFEFAKPEAILDLVRSRGFDLTRLATVGGSMGCNEFVFVRVPGRTSPP